MKFIITIISTATIIFLTHVFIGERIDYKSGIVKVYTEEHDNNSVLLDFDTVLSQGSRHPGLLIKENSDNIVIGFVECPFFQLCFVDSQYINGKILIKNNNKPIFARYQLKLTRGEINRLEQVWP